VPCSIDGDCASLGASDRCESSYCRGPEFDDPAAQSGRVELADLCSLYVRDLCEIGAACGRSDYCDTADCESANECLGLSSLQQAVAQGRVTYDPVQAFACHRKIVDAPCTFAPLLFSSDVPSALIQCTGVLTGRVTPGQSCDFNAECAAGAECVFSASCPGTCVARGAQGAACDAAGSASCAVGLECHDGTCEPPWQLGQACTGIADCAPFWCDQAQGTCAPLATLGATCSFVGAYGAPPCTVGLLCNAQFQTGSCETAGQNCFFDADCPAPMVCLPGPTAVAPGSCAAPVAQGAACNSEADCGAGLRCDPTSLQCLPFAALGEACSSDVGAPPCQQGLACDGTVCRSVSCPGQDCSAGQVCNGSRCVGGACVPLARLGARCTGNSDCASQDCSGNVCVDGSGCNL
jgi:hypothetical protein